MSNKYKPILIMAGIVLLIYLCTVGLFDVIAFVFKLLFGSVLKIIELIIVVAAILIVIKIIRGKGKGKK